MTPFDTYISTLKNRGFQPILIERFVREAEYLHDRHAEAFYVLWDGAVMIVAESFEGERVNAATAYYNLMLGEREFDRLPGGSGGLIATPEGAVWEGHTRIGPNASTAVGVWNDLWPGVPMQEWTKAPHVWLVRGDEEEEAPDDAHHSGYYQEITEGRIEKLPEEVQTAIGGWRENGAPTDLFDVDTEPEITSADTNGEFRYKGGGRDTVPLSEVEIKE